MSVETTASVDQQKSAPQRKSSFLNRKTLTGAAALAIAVSDPGRATPCGFHVAQFCRFG
jgi:hypothetical protein